MHLHGLQVQEVLELVAAGASVNFTVAASGDSTIAFSETTSVLTSNSDTPASTMNLSLNSSTGAITGTAPAATSETTYNFTLRATDAESQTADRAFSITVSVGINNSGVLIMANSYLTEQHHQLVIKELTQYQVGIDSVIQIIAV